MVRLCSALAMLWSRKVDFCCSSRCRICLTCRLRLALRCLQIGVGSGPKESTGFVDGLGSGVRSITQ